MGGTQVLVEARDAAGGTHSVLLQNAETVKLVGLAPGGCAPQTGVEAGLGLTSSGSSSSSRGSSSGSSSGGGAESSQGSAQGDVESQQEGGPGRVDDHERRTWRVISVAALKPGDHVLLHRPATAARHMGIPIQEFIVEQ